jgi:UDP-N-acetylglucosamine 2-epimerase (non-hydrolysing)
MVAAVGTRPEAIKLAPVALIARRRPDVDLRLVGSGQHEPEMLEALGHFGLRPHEEVALFEHGQSLAGLTTSALSGFTQELACAQPDVVVVQGDTTTAFAAALAAFYARIPVAHVEAGLRTHDMAEPFPEEMNRKLIDSIAQFHFPPTSLAESSLGAEGVVGPDVFTTGNTIVDALRSILKRNHARLEGRAGAAFDDPGRAGRVLVTAHRRESWGQPMDEIAAALGAAAASFPGHVFVLPLHPNPIVRRSFAEARLPANVVAVEPLPYPQFVAALSRADLVVTDSGGVVEEATALGRTTLILRNRTERPEAVLAGAARIVGTGRAGIETAVADALLGRHAGLPPLPVFGDGRASARIVDWLRWRHGLADERPAPFADDVGEEAQAAPTRTRPKRTFASS